MEASLNWKLRFGVIHTNFYTPLENQSSTSDHHTCHLVILHSKQKSCYSLILISVWHEIFKRMLSYLTFPSYHMSFCHLQVCDPLSHMGWHTSSAHSLLDNSTADSNIYLTGHHRPGHPLIMGSLKHHRHMQLKKPWQSAKSFWNKLQIS